MKISNGAAAAIIAIVLVIVGYFVWRSFQPSLSLTPQQQIQMESHMKGAPSAPASPAQPGH